MKDFYTNHAWTGEKYDSKLTMKEIATLVKKDLKEAFKDSKINIRQAKSTHLSKLDVTVKVKDYNFYATDSSELDEDIARRIRIELIDKNGGSITRDELDKQIKEYLKNNSVLNGKYYEAKEQIETIVNAYNYDDSDSMQDYFDVNYYYDIKLETM